MQINSNVNVKNNPTLTQALLKYMEQKNIKKDTDVLENFLMEFGKTLEIPKTEEEKPETGAKPDEKTETEAKADEKPEVKENDEKNKENENK